ncbi:MAG: NADH-quinone oxidoreductase subunit N [Coriobacteriales bacterium]|nr:NADH-quinone oxidoreductase subunit N [Coriobacteriales bacterium]
MADPTVALTFLAPEIIVALTGALVLVIDLIWIRSTDAPNTPRPWLAYLSIAGLGLAAGAVIGLAGVQTTLFEGIVILDPLSTFFKLLFLAIGMIVLLISVDPLPGFSKWSAEFFALIVWCTLGNMLLASAAELFTIFLCLQLTSLPLIVLIGYAKRDPLSSEASLKYLLLVLVSTAVLLYGMTLVYGALGTSTISEIGKVLAEQRLTPVLALGLVLLLTGFGFKITAVPFQYWVPDVYEGAPSPVTAFLSVGSKFAGFALALRIIVTGLDIPLNWHLIFGVMAALSMTLGNLGALRQTNIKRMLAYSGIAQAGYLLVGLAALSEMGIASLLFYTAAYGFANLLAFTAVIVFANATGSYEISDYAGLARRAPLASFALTVALLSLGGLPLLAGFMAKFYVFLFAAQAGLIWLVAVGVVNSVIALYYYLRVIWQLYVPEGSLDPISVAPRAGLAMSVCAVGVFAIGVFPEPVLRASQMAASALFGG